MVNVYRRLGLEWKVFRVHHGWFRPYFEAAVCICHGRFPKASHLWFHIRGRDPTLLLQEKGYMSHETEDDSLVSRKFRDPIHDYRESPLAQFKHVSNVAHFLSIQLHSSLTSQLSLTRTSSWTSLIPAELWEKKNIARSSSACGPLNSSVLHTMCGLVHHTIGLSTVLG